MSLTSIIGLLIALTCTTALDAKALLPGDLPLAKRRAILTPFFSPKPGGQLRFRAEEVRDFASRVTPYKLRGWIKVSPPHGTCLTIERAKDESDETICKATDVSFTFANLDRAGRLTWTVKTGDGDFGTELTWDSSYRLASVIPYGTDPVKDPPVYKYLGECLAERTPTGRRIKLRVLGGDEWIIHFPSHDQLAPQPEALTNLSVNEQGGPKRGISDAPTAPADAAKGGGEHGEKPPAEPKPAAKPAVPDAEDDRKAWSIPLRGAYVMNADGFQPHGAVAHGLRGQCRYIYHGPAEDPETGRLECHEADGFAQVYLPLTCLKGLKGSI